MSTLNEDVQKAAKKQVFVVFLKGMVGGYSVVYFSPQQSPDRDVGSSSGALTALKPVWTTQIINHMVTRFSFIGSTDDQRS